MIIKYLAISGLIVGMMFIVSCGGAPSFIARNTQAPDLKYCNDVTGHKAGAASFVLGGTCTCTPTTKRYEQCKTEGTIGANLSYEQYLDLFTSKGIKTDLDHKGCNNRCQWGPHVVFGGKCMTTPTPGTLNYERVVSGNQTLTLEEINHANTY